MLPNPSPRKSGMSFTEIRNPEGSFISSSMQKISAASVTRIATICIELKP